MVLGQLAHPGSAVAVTAIFVPELAMFGIAANAGIPGAFWSPATLKRIQKEKVRRAAWEPEDSAGLRQPVFA